MASAPNESMPEPDFEEAETAQDGVDAEFDELHVFWVTGGSCDGCTIAAAGATDPGVEDLLNGHVPQLPKLNLHHPVLATEWGEDYVDEFRAAERGERDPYAIVVEGSVPNERLIAGEGSKNGYWIAAGEGEDGNPIRCVDWLDRLAPGAAATIAIGTCASWGGIPASEGNPTDAMGVMDYLGRDYRSVLGLPVINVPGCSPVGDNFIETVAHTLLYAQDLAPHPELDELGRPKWLFGESVHRSCNRGSYYEEGDFAEEYGSEKCLVEKGCWGPVVKCNMPSRRAVDGVGGCMNIGGKCIGCTMPGFPDKFTPYFKKPPGTMISSTSTKLLGSVMTRLRDNTTKKLDKHRTWDEEEGGVGMGERLYQWYHKRGSNYQNDHAVYNDGRAD